jgi:glycerol kinase
VLDGIAHSVCDLIDGVADTMGAPFTRLRVGGGVSGSDPLMQIQADLSGLPLERVSGSASASLRGTAYLAGVAQGLWSSLEEVVEAQERGRVFEPSITAAERTELRVAWRDVLIAHLNDPALLPLREGASEPHTPH